MLAKLIGAVDINSAAVLCIGFICICVVVTTVIGKRRSRQDVANEFALAKMKQEADDKQRLYGLETARAVEFKKIETGLITSHRES